MPKPWPACARLRQGRQRDRRQCLGHQRRRRRRGGDERQEGRSARPETAGADRQLRHQCWTRPAIMGMGPVPAREGARARRLEAPADVDLLEINEGLRGPGLRRASTMGWDTSKVNVNGGAIAIGHPIGASGCRVLVSLLHEMQKPRRQEGHRVAVHRRRHGRGPDGRSLKRQGGVIEATAWT